MSIKIENVVLPSPEQWDAVIRGMRNPKNSWDRSDSHLIHIENPHTLNTAEFQFFLGEKDETLMKQLASGGPVHAKYRRMIPVYMDITRPLYWWKEMDTYKIGTVANSCSTMHKLPEKEFTLEDFSTEHLICNLAHPIIEEFKDHLDVEERNTLECYLLSHSEHDLLEVYFEDTVEYLSPIDIFEQYIINAMNLYRDKYLEATKKLKRDDLTEAERKHVKAQQKCYWWQMIQLLPSSYNQKRTVMLNYEVLVGIYKWRRNHKLDEWHVFCDWIESLPYSWLITGEEG